MSSMQDVVDVLVSVCGLHMVCWLKWHSSNEDGDACVNGQMYLDCPLVIPITQDIFLKQE